MTEPPRADDDDVLVAFLLAEPGLLDMILSQHVDDGRGDCPACPGPQSGRRRFPCDIRRAADGRSGAVLVSEPPPPAADDDVAVAFLLAHPDLLDTLGAEHVDDGAGRCAACSDPEFGPRRWPCPVRLVVARVMRIRGREVPPGV